LGDGSPRVSQIGACSAGRPSSCGGCLQCAEEDSNLHGTYIPQGPQPGAPVVRVLCCFRRSSGQADSRTQRTPRCVAERACCFSPTFSRAQRPNGSRIAALIAIGV
jgi:hypothetical protein